MEFGATLNEAEFEKKSSDVWIHKTAIIAPSAYIGSAVIIGAYTEVRHCAYVRGSVLVGNGAVVGNSTEVKNAILFDEVQVPHYNYVGDSILGYKSNMGAGAITSNMKSDRTIISMDCGNTRIDTGLKKFGAVLGDYVEVGSNSVLNPGSVVGSGASIYPLSMVRGFVPSDSIYKRQGEIVQKYERKNE
jgi:NDP-sugar pyrophosphorylase family protein